MAIGAALDTLGLIADRQTDVPPELKAQLKVFGREQLAISFTEMTELDDEHVSASLTGVLLITEEEAEMFVNAEDIDSGLELIVASREKTGK